MAKQIEHKTLIVKAGVDWCFENDQKDFMERWLLNLVKDLGMETMDEPRLTYMHDPGFKGWTCTVHIKTSHIAFHSWEEKSPVRIDLQVYTCGKMNVDVIKKAVDLFTIREWNAILIDMENNLEILDIENSN